MIPRRMRAWPVGYGGAVRAACALVAAAWAASCAAAEPVTASRGPRELPPTFVHLEVGSFPRPAAEACRDNRRLLRVRPPTGIARALAAARPGTTVLAAPGTYTESRGEPTALEWRTPNVCLRAEGGGEVVLRALPGQKYGIAIGGSDTVVEGITVRGFAGSIGLYAGEGRTQRRVTIEHVRVEQPRGEFRDGIVAYADNRSVPGRPPAVDGLLLLDVSISGADLGISCNAGPCAHWWVERTRVQARGGASESSGADAFAIEDGRQIAVVDATFAGASADGIDTKADDVVVFGARVLDVARNGIKLWRGGDVIDSVVDGSGADAALVGDGPGRYRYLHVLVRRHGRPDNPGYAGAWGYDRPHGAFRIEIVNAIFAENAGGGLFAPAGARLSVRHTIFGDTRGKLLDRSDGRSFDVPELEAFQRAGFGAGNVAADPLLVLSGRRWSTRPQSPARDRGEPIPGLLRDLDGRPRALGAGPDAGPVESG